MGKRKKTIIISAVLIILVAVVIGTGMYYNNRGSQESDPESPQKETDVPVYVKGWAGESLYLICYTDGQTKSERDTGRFVYRTYFSTSLSKEQLVQTNPSDYVGEFTLYAAPDNIRLKEDTTGSVFYRKNNYYVIYESEYSVDLEGETQYTAQSLMARWCLINFASKEVNFPCPVLLYISEETINEYQKNYKKSYLDLLFDNFSFEECEEFYSRLDERICEIDKEEKTITVEIGYGCKIVIDYTNKTITGPAYVNSSEYYTEKYITLTGEKMATPWINE